mgnify:CR=1 FL=1
MNGYKHITLKLEDKTFEASIDSTMREDAIYDAMRSAMDTELDSKHFMIMDTKRNIKARLHFLELHINTVYGILPFPIRVQGPGSFSRAAQKCTHNVFHILKNWGLRNAADIFPKKIAPRERNADGEVPHVGDGTLTAVCGSGQWSKRFTEKLRLLSARTKGQHVEAIEILQAEVKARHEREGRAVVEVVTKDLVAVADKWAEKVEQEKVGVDDHNDDKGVFTEGMAEGLETTEDGGGYVGWAYEQDGKFKIGTHFK